MSDCAKCTYKYMSAYITLTSIILLPSEIISICLCLINITNSLAFTFSGSVLNSSNN